MLLNLSPPTTSLEVLPHALGHMPWAACIQRSVTSTVQDTYEKETYKPAFELQPKTCIQWVSKLPSLCLREKGQNRTCHIRKSSIAATDHTRPL